MNVTHLTFVAIYKLCFLCYDIDVNQKPRLRTIIWITQRNFIIFHRICDWIDWAQFEKVEGVRMADENNEDDSWLYGSSNENQDSQDEPPQIDEKAITEEAENARIDEVSRNDEYSDDQHVSVIVNWLPEMKWI